tara:strand:- start:3 stop:239 length:237 start_codon:yes stop_codon:yes gene_type:complete
MGRKSNDVETRKRKTKKDKARRKKELFGKYRLTRQGDTIASKKPKNQKKNFSKSSQNQKKSKKNFSKSSQKSKTKSKK